MATIISDFHSDDLAAKVIGNLPAHIMREFNQVVEHCEANYVVEIIVPVLANVLTPECAKVRVGDGSYRYDGMGITQQQVAWHLQSIEECASQETEFAKLAFD